MRIQTGFREIDGLTSGLQSSDLVILAANSGMGKTALALNIARNVAVDCNVPVVVFSTGMPNEQVSMRMLCAESRIGSSRLREGLFSSEDWKKLSDASKILGNAPIYLVNLPYFSGIGVKRKINQLKNITPKFLIIDGVKNISSINSSDNHVLISDMGKSLKNLASELEIPVLALIDLNVQANLRKDKRPQVADLREFGNIDQDADLVFFIHRDDFTTAYQDDQHIEVAEIILAKNNNGATAKASLVFTKEFVRFDNLN